MEMHEGSSSSGSKDDDSCKLRLEALVKVGAELPEKYRGCTPVMVSITAPSRTSMQRQRAPIDVVLVLHVHIRCKVPENWHDLLKQATNLIVKELGEEDRLAIVPALLKETRIIFEDAVVVPVKPKLLLMSPENKAAASNSVESSEAMRSNTLLMKDLESAESILFGRESDDKENRAGYIIVISNSNEDMSSMLHWRFRSVHAFGFCDARNARTMFSIASSRESTYGVLDKDGMITPALTESLSKITFAAEPVEVKLKCKQEVVLSAVLAPRINYFISHDKKTGIIWAKAHLANPVTNFILYIGIPGDYHWSDKNDDLLNIQVKYGYGPNSVNLKVAPLVLFTARGTDKSAEVAAEIVRMEAFKIIGDITAKDKTDRGDQLHGAALELRARWSQLVEETNYGREAASAGILSVLDAEMKLMEASLLRQDSFWLQHMLSWRSHQWWPLPPLKKKGKTTSPTISGVDAGFKG